MRMSALPNTDMAIFVSHPADIPSRLEMRSNDKLLEVAWNVWMCSHKWIFATSAVATSCLLIA